MTAEVAAAGADDPSASRRNDDPSDPRRHADASWRERKKQQTRTALHRAAVTMVAERGIGGVTTEEIAEQAGVSARTFFNYFPTKESAVLGMGPDEPDRVAGWLTEQPDDVSPAEAVRACFTRFALDLAADEELWRLRRKVVRSDPTMMQAMASVSAAVERRVTEALADRLGVDADDDLRPGLLVSITWAAVRTGTSHSREHQIPVGDAIREALELMDSLMTSADGPTASTPG